MNTGKDQPSEDIYLSEVAYGNSIDQLARKLADAISQHIVALGGAFNPSEMSDGGVDLQDIAKNAMMFGGVWPTSIKELDEGPTIAEAS